MNRSLTPRCSIHRTKIQTRKLVSGLNHSSLLTTARNYLRLETLHAANDAIDNAIAGLPVFHQYDIQDELHSSSDGQRTETQINTINARHSSKYFGLKLHYQDNKYNPRTPIKNPNPILISFSHRKADRDTASSGRVP